jgi:hypothetical protein
MSKFNKEELIQRTFLRAASIMFGMWEEKDSSDTRLLNPPIIPDEYVKAGESVNGREHREHVVPRVCICYQCHKMFSEGAELKDVAKFIRKYLKIVFISNEEHQRLDQGKQMNLRQKMPLGWTFESGDVYARLHLAKIEFNLYDE